MTTPNRPTMPVSSGMSRGHGATLEEIEQEMMSQSKSVKKPMTAEQLERELRGEDQRVPQIPLHHPRNPYPVPPNVPLPGSPGFMGSPAGQVPPRFHTPQAQVNPELLYRVFLFQ